MLLIETAYATDHIWIIKQQICAYEYIWSNEIVSVYRHSWWRHEMETCSALLALYVTRGNDVFFECAWTKDWVNNRDAGDLKRHCAHHDAIVITVGIFIWPEWKQSKRNCLALVIKWYHVHVRLPGTKTVKAFSKFTLKILLILYLHPRASLPLILPNGQSLPCNNVFCWIMGLIRDWFEFMQWRKHHAYGINSF